MEVTDPAAAAAEATRTVTTVVTVAAAMVEVVVVAMAEGKFSFFPAFHHRVICALRQPAAASRTINDLALHDCISTENILTRSQWWLRRRLRRRWWWLRRRSRW